MMKMLTVAALGAIATLLPMSEQAAPPGPGEDLVEWCLLSGGDVVDQPAGSAIAACCTSDGCIICDASWNNCHFEPTHGGRGAAAGLPGLGGPDTMAPGSQGRPSAGSLAPPLLQAR